MSETPTYDPDARYDLRVSRKIELGVFVFLPRDTIEASGKTLNRIVREHGADVIASAVIR